MKRIGVLALQGAFEAHVTLLGELGADAVCVRKAGQLGELDGLILPGGESTAQWRLIHWSGMYEALLKSLSEGLPTLGICAGLILLARDVQGPAQPSLGLLDIAVLRNGYGRQLDSFEGQSDSGRPLVFIRAPKILACGPSVEIVDRLDGAAICVRQGQMVAAAFHPELTGDLAPYRHLLG